MGELTDEEKEAAKDAWFNTPPLPVQEGRKERQLQWFLDQVETSLPGDGFSVGGRPSLADVYFFDLLGEHAKELGAKGEPFGSLEDTTRTLARYSKLSAVVDTYKSSPGMSY